MSNLIRRGVRTHGDSRTERFVDVRTFTEELAAPLSAEDQTVQSMPDASPTKWHLAHTTWFFETFVLAAVEPGARPFDPAYAFLFNSYYEAVGPRQPRPERGLLSRPPLEAVLKYRRAVDERVGALLAGVLPDPLLDVVELGIAHEEQHQELCQKLQGHYQYYGIRGNYRLLEVVMRHAERAWRYWLSRRSQKGMITGNKRERWREQFPLPTPKIVHNI